MKSEKRFQVFGHIVMIIITLCAILPLILLLISSFTDNDVLVRNGYSFIPEKWSAYAYSYIFTSGDSVPHAYLISVILTVVGTACGLIITTLMGYALSKNFLPGRGVLTFIVFFTMLFNGGLVPTYINYTNVFGLKNTFFALLIPGLMMNAFNVMMVKSYFVTGVPEEILEAAYIDGATEYQTFFRIAMPLAKPIIIVYPFIQNNFVKGITLGGVKG